MKPRTLGCVIRFVSLLEGLVGNSGEIEKWASNSTFDGWGSIDHPKIDNARKAFSHDFIVRFAV